MCICYTNSFVEVSVFIIASIDFFSFLFYKAKMSKDNTNEFHSLTFSYYL